MRCLIPLLNREISLYINILGIKTVENIFLSVINQKPEPKFYQKKFSAKLLPPGQSSFEGNLPQDGAFEH